MFQPQELTYEYQLFLDSLSAIKKYQNKRNYVYRLVFS